MAIDRTDTLNKIVDIVTDQLHIDDSLVTENAALDSLGADSLDRVEIIMKIEEAFDIEIDDEQAEKLKTIKDAVDYVHNLRTK
jgi:acyl carrier protein